MSDQSLHLIEALLGSEAARDHAEGRGKHPLPAGPTVTVARDHGSGGSEFAQALAARLGVRCLDREVLDAIAQEAHVPRALIERLDEHVSSRLEDWSYSILWGKSSHREDYVRYLRSVCVGVAMRGGVIIGRGANFILNTPKSFRLRIAAPESVCARRVAERETLSEEKALEKVRRVNEERARFARVTFHRDWNDVSWYDLVLNSERWNTDQMVTICIQSMRAAGFDIPEKSPDMAERV